ncbi:MAG: hypothetical protein II490_03905 [Oscillospiraceae bacterium]|nr:hypothetical protein [Oscillospiraceae bacterium]
MLAYLRQKYKPPRRREGYANLIDAVRTLADDAKDDSVRSEAALLLKKWECER